MPAWWVTLLGVAGLVVGASLWISVLWAGFWLIGIGRCRTCDRPCPWWRDHCWRHLTEVHEPRRRR